MVYKVENQTLHTHNQKNCFFATAKKGEINNASYKTWSIYS